MGDARIVLTTLIDEKLLTPGPKKLYVSYYRKRVYADLLPDGSIRFKDQVYTSPVPCALHMKRTLNPSLKTDAGWSSMYSAASGESLKDIKDRLNIRKRGTNARSAHKEKKAPVPPPITKEKMVQAAAAQTKQEAAPKCAACRKEAAAEVAECSACHSQTHFKCASPPLQASPVVPWFCEKCVTGQANRILEFLQQTRRVLVERIAEQKKAKQETEKPKEIVTMEQVSTEDKQSEAADAAKDAEEKPKEIATMEQVSTEDKPSEAADAAKDAEEDEEMPSDAAEEKDGEADMTDNSEKPAPTEKETSTEASIDASAAETAEPTEPKDATSTSTEALEEKEFKQEGLDALTTNVQTKNSEEIVVVDEEDKPAKETESVAVKPTTPPSAEEKFLVLVDSLIAEVSSKTERANLIANSTGATLVHLEKTQLVQLVEYGKREILAATQPDSEDDDVDGETDDDHDTSRSNTSEVDDLIRIFDLRHQILSSKAQFERTTSTLAKRTEKHLRNAETELMDLEESRTVEAAAIMKVVDLINQYSGDLNKCEQKIHFDETLLESISHRRNFIRSTNINDHFVPAYRYSSKLMTTSSDQLLLTVLLDKLRDTTESVNEWTKMENHFEKMTSSLKKSLTLIGTKRKRTGAPVKLPPTPALFAKVKIPPSRRLIERQIANYQVNLNAIRQNRARMRKTLSGVLKITREEHLSEEIVNMTDMLYQKCRDLKAEEEEEQLKLKEEGEAETEAKEDAERHDQSTDDGEASAEEPETKKPRLNGADTPSENSPEIAAGTNVTLTGKEPTSNEVKGISSLLGSEDSDAKESNYSSAESKSRADNDDDSEGDLEQASRAIADITSSVLPDISGARMDLLNSPPMTAKPAAETTHELVPQGHFSIRGGKGVDKKESTRKEAEQQKGQSSKTTGQSEQSFLDQALEVLNKQQQQQQRLEQQRIEQQRQLEQQQKKLEEQQQQLEKQRRLEQQRQLEQQRLEQQRQERERQERERRERERLENQRLERQRIEKQLQEQERREQQRREQQRLEQERREQQRIEQQRIEEQRRMEEQRRIEEEQRRLEKQRLEQQQKQRLEQQRLEQQRQEKQRQEQQRLEKQRLEQQRLEQQRLEQQRLEQQRLEQQRLEQQRLEQQRLEQQRLEQQRLEQQRLEQQRQEKQRQEQQRQEQQRRQQEQQRLELQHRQQEQQRQEQQRQFQRNKAPNLPQVVQPGSSHLQMLNQQQLQQQQAALQQQQHSRQIQHPLYGDIPKGMLMSSGLGTSQQDIYVQQAAQMGMDMHDVVRHQDSGHFVGNASGGLRGPPYEVSRSEPAPTAPRTSFYGDDGQTGQMHSQDVFGSQGMSGQQRQLPDHHMFANELQQQQAAPPQSRGMVSQDFLMGRSYRHPGMDQPDDNDVNMGDWGQ
ncbi:hypothetical protein PR003_g19343 [Phytophthora rubi]|uniref:Zinc finger PHD-type domain-containing protein n=1 Tax=Phytophthora rubi TaxID=129364 RepID=A0A6A3JR65_9STRA|nr:hypothetical protein PR002_g18927 [Phytophthora rubi]KAE9001470.1 hypothetical protein PR001_g18514 [Phytophthora rubi]KAE9314087.1 hypothetical protein PR003_g19343 [Phytophthora rubi]